MSNISRRGFIASTALLGIGLTIDGVSASTKPSDRRFVSVKETKEEAIRYWLQQGYLKTAPASLITGLDYNGGLNYDDSVQHYEPDLAQFVVQPCSRIEDITNQNKLGTLPIFNILAFSWTLDVDFTHATKLLFDYLIDHVRLDPSRLRVTTTIKAEQLFPVFESYGVLLPQIRLRSLKEAMDVGDGSGYFAPNGHPNSPAFPTYSVEYALSSKKTKHSKKSDDFDMTAIEIELAEMGVTINPGFYAGGFGLERLTMARNDQAMHWGDYLPVFKHTVLADAQHEHNPLPSGYYEILASMTKGF